MMIDRLKELLSKELDSFVIKDTYTKGKNAGLRKALALIADIEPALLERLERAESMLRIREQELANRDVLVKDAEERTREVSKMGYKLRKEWKARARVAEASVRELEIDRDFYKARTKELNATLESLLPGILFYSCCHKEHPDADTTWHCCDWSDAVERVIQQLNKFPKVI